MGLTIELVETKANLNELLGVLNTILPYQLPLSKNSMVIESQISYICRNENGIPIGGVACFIPEPKNVYIAGIGLLAAYRCQGFGKILLEKVISSSTEKNFVNISLHCRSDSLDAANFYEKNGFKKKKEITRYYRRENMNAFEYEYVVSTSKPS